MPQLRIALFGGCDVTIDGERVGSPLSPHAQALLAYLALNRESPYARTTLAALLWPNEPEQTAEDNLQTVVFEVQRLLNQRLYDAPPFLLANRESVTLNPASSITLDTVTFENRLYAVTQHQHRRIDACPQCIQRLTRALEMYTGLFLDGVQIESQQFEVWLALLRDQYKAQVLEALEPLLFHYQLVEDYEQVANYARIQIAVAPWDERGHLSLLRALLAQGEIGVASAHYESLRQQYASASNIGLPQSLAEAYSALKIPLERQKPAKSETLRTDNSVLFVLPQSDMPIIGREAELLQLSDWLSEDTEQYILLTGPGGIGKTHLALAVAEATRGAFENGVAYVVMPESEGSGEEENPTSADKLQRIDSISHPAFSPYGDRIIEVLRKSLQLSFDPELPEDQQLFDQLRDCEMLIILDNVERCPGKVSSLINELRAVAPRITLLMCSQLYFDNDNLRTLEITPFPVPRQTDSALAADYPSIRLFVAYAQRHYADFALDEDVLPAVIDICQQVEGLPLGIILAATWMPNFTVSQIADAVRRDLSVLVATSSMIPERHRSLQALFESSWRLLSLPERLILGQAAVFRGGFDRLAAAAVLEVDGVLGDILRILVKNGFLLEYDAGRYDLPRIVRQYVMTVSMLTENKEDDDVVAYRHATYYLNPDKWQQDIVGFETDIHNIRHAWQWAAENGSLSTFSSGLMGWIDYLEKRGRFQEGSSSSDLLIWRLKYREDLDSTLPQIQDMIGRLYVARGSFLTMLGNYTEASEVIQYALSLAVTDGNAPLETAVQLAWGTLMWRLGDYPSAQTRITQALQLAQQLQDGDTMQRCLYQLGVVTMHQSDYAVAQMYLQQSLELSKGSLDGYHEGMVLNAMGFLAQSLGDYTLARIYLQDALQSFERTGSMWGKGTAQQHLGIVAHRLGDYDEARTWYEQALFTNRECANRYAEAKTLASLGLLFYHQGEFEATHKACRQAYDFVRQLGDRATEAEVLMVWGHAYAGQNEIIEAAAAYQKALDHRQELGQFDEATEAIAGLVRLALKQGAGVHTMPFVERILDRIRSSESLKGANEPLRIYLTCYLALKDNNDPRASRVLDRAYNVLMAQADKLENPTERQSLLSNVAVHRDIVNLYEGT